MNLAIAKSGTTIHPLSKSGQNWRNMTSKAAQRVGFH